MSLTKMVKIDAQIDTQFLYTIDSLELITRNPIRKDKNIEAREYYVNNICFHDSFTKTGHARKIIPFNSLRYYNQQKSSPFI